MKQQKKEQLYRIIFQSDTPGGKLFDVILLFVICISVLAVILESVDSLQVSLGGFFIALEWAITIVFTVEYILRIWVVRKSWRYIFSFYGIIDLLSILPTYLGIFFAGTRSLLVIRALRLLRVFRVLKLSRYTNAATTITEALRASAVKISVFLFAVLMMVIIIGTTMYLIEGKENGFKNIPTSIYWAIVTLTTVGYGDIAPVTTVGKVIASLVMVMGYGIIAVPTGIVTAQVIQSQHARKVRVCQKCGERDHDQDARFCKHCGQEMGGDPEAPA